MAASFVLLYNCLVRGIIVQPTGSWFLPQAEDQTSPAELVGLDATTASSSAQLFSCLYGVGQIPEVSKPSVEIDADRRISFGPLNDINQNGLEFDNNIAADYPDSYKNPSHSADWKLYTSYPVTTSPTPTRRLPEIYTAKRNCHIIKCPKLSYATYGTDGSSCYEFANPCFLAVASCKRSNNRLPRLKEVTKKQCDTLVNFSS